MSFAEKTVLGSSVDEAEVANVIDGELPVVQEDLIPTLNSRGVSTEELLSEILKQQKLTNLYLQSIYGKGEFKTRDIED